MRHLKTSWKTSEIILLLYWMISTVVLCRTSRRERKKKNNQSSKKKPPKPRTWKKQLKFKIISLTCFLDIISWERPRLRKVWRQNTMNLLLSTSLKESKVMITISTWSCIQKKICIFFFFIALRHWMLLCNIKCPFLKIRCMYFSCNL